MRVSNEVLNEWIGVMEKIPSDSYQGFQAVSLAYDLRDARTRITELESTEESMRCDIVDLSQKLSEANAKLAEAEVE